MGFSKNVSDEPLTPIGRLFFHNELAQVVHIAVGMKNHIDVEAIKAAMKDSVMVKHPRFCSLMVRDCRGIEHWRKTDVNIDQHIIVIDEPVMPISDRGSGSSLDRDEAAVNEYLADMSLSFDLDEHKPLWEIHVLKQHKCMVFRIHHSIGDGMSLMSMVQALCMRVADDDSPGSFPAAASQLLNGKLSWRYEMAKLVQRVWFSVMFIIGLSLRSIWVRDPNNPISGGDGVELWPRKLATARFRIDDMKLIKRVLPGATINDVLIGVISAGLHRYFDHKWPGLIESGMQMTGVAAVNLRKQSGLQDLTKLMNNDSSLRWGNIVGFMLLPLYCNRETGSNPLDHITRAKNMLDRKKSSFEAAFSLWLSNVVMSWFGAKVAAWFMKKLICNTTFTVSNMVGPQERVTYIGNPITYIRASVTSMPHALTMHMVTYAGRADLQILVAKDIIPDPEFLAECFEGALEGALMDMKAALDDGKD